MTLKRGLNYKAMYAALVAWVRKRPCLMAIALIWNMNHVYWDNTVTLFLMYRVIRISCLLRAILAELRSGATEEASIALNKQEIRITRYIRKRVTVLTLLLGKWWPPQYFSSLQDDSIAVHNCNTYLLFAIVKFSIASKSIVLQYINAIHISCLFLCTI